MDVSVQGIVFDKDGVLFDFRASWEGWAAQVLRNLAEGDEGLAARMGAAVGFDLDEQRFASDSVVIAGTQGEIAAALAPFLRAAPDLVERLNIEAAEAPQVETVPLRKLMTELRGRGLKLGVATNDGIDPALAHLRSVDAVDCFDFIAGYDSGHGSKPGPGQLLAFCAAEGLAPEACLMIGDSLHDMRAGRAAGMRRIAVLTGMATQADLAPEADAVLPDIGHLPAWLDAQSTP